MKTRTKVGNYKPKKENVEKLRVFLQQQQKQKND